MRDSSGEISEIEKMKTSYRYRNPSFTRVISLLFVLPWLAVPQQSGFNLRCRVLDDIDHQPVMRAKITITGGKATDAIFGYTDPQGTYQASNLAPGRYTVSVEKAGYFPRARGGSSESTPVEVVNESTSDVSLGDIVLTRLRSIRGRVKWQSGDPADHVIAHALLVKRGKAVFRAGDALLAMTDERGEFRIANLKPGRYVVYAYTIGLAPEAANSPVALPVFYPNSPFPDTSGAVDLRNTAEATSISMTFQETHGTSIEGTVVPSSALPEGSPFQVGLMIPENPAQPFVATTGKVGQPFRLHGVPPGRYTLIALSSNNSKIRSIRPLEVDAVPLKDVRISVGEIQTIRGHVKYDDSDANDTKSSSAVGGGVVPTAHRAEGIAFSTSSTTLQMFGLGGGRTNSDGEFSLNAFPGETYALSIQSPADAYISEVIQGSNRLTGSPFGVTGGAGDVLVVLKADGGVVSGQIKAEKEQAGNAFVVLAPRDRSRQDLFRTTIAGNDGTFTLKNIAPGEYVALGLPRNDEDYYLDPDYIDQFERYTTKISIAPASQRNIVLTLAPMPTH
jgi:hypothetical protein